MSALNIFAGPSALQHIRQNGLDPGAIEAVFGASGAAKWLTIYALDKTIFSDFLPVPDRQVTLFGTSIGAFKLAAAAQIDPGAALTRLADAYIEQRYEGKVTAESVADESRRITAHMLGQDGAAQILAHPLFRFHCGTVRCRGWLASPSPLLQRGGMLKAFGLAALGRTRLRHVVRRTIWSDARALGDISGADGYPTDQRVLDRDNFHKAILASGSIPIVMRGVTGLGGNDVYRDGGLLDYHPVPSALRAAKGGLILYPHFYPYLIEGWFDKFFANRRVSAARLDNVVLLAPSADYVASLPGGKIPDRKDFHTFAGKDDARQVRWREAVARSEELGDAFKSLVRSGDIAAAAQPL